MDYAETKLSGEDQDTLALEYLTLEMTINLHSQSVLYLMYHIIVELSTTVLVTKTRQLETTGVRRFAWQY